MSNINTINEIIGKYTAGKAALEDTNAALAAAGSDLRIDPDHNALTADELAQTTADSPETANGYGLLDVGLGKLSKVQVKDGHLVDNDVGDMYALLLIGGKTYHVKGAQVVE